uniref:Neprosin PEP catalytic domain-containing protein n=1 Tax=Oryza meridionalis TaxID=40149 RepID=A0A0E0CSI1_9ORYZ
MEEKLAISIVTLCLTYLVLVGGVKIHIDRDGIIGSTIPSKDLNMTIQELIVQKTGDGDVYDCVDIYKQPAMNHPLLKNHIIQMEPSSYPLDLDIQSILSSNISESNFPDIKCPTGTIPILRHNSSEAHMPNGGSQEEVWPSFSGDNFVRFHIRWDRKTKDWWLACLDKSSVIGYRPLGYWPSKLFDTLQEKATYAFWGGWVRGPTVSSDPPPMGSGHFAKEGYRKAAFVKGIRIANKDNNFVNPNVGKATTVTTRGLCYTVDGFGVLKMGMRVFFGGPGQCPK